MRKVRQDYNFGVVAAEPQAFDLLFKFPKQNNISITTMLVRNTIVFHEDVTIYPYK